MAFGIDEFEIEFEEEQAESLNFAIEALNPNTVGKKCLMQSISTCNA
jgi:hypothetical protein